MIRVGMLVRVIYPPYASGMEGCIQEREGKGLWLVKLKENSINPQKESVVLSLEASEFEVIDAEYEE